MITVKVEMWPLGSEERKYEIGRMYIANVGGDAKRGDYEVAVCRRGTDAVPAPINPYGPLATRVGEVRRYPRLSYNMWRLIVRALRSAFPEEDRRAPACIASTGIDVEEEAPLVDEDSMLGQTLAAKDAEIARLREALELIVDSAPDVRRDIARKALER